MPPKGWTQRDLALAYIRENYDEKIPAVVYFGDDDNSYDVRLFTDYIRNVKRIGIWAVAFSALAYVEAFRVEDGKIVKWMVVDKINREFAVDMAGFAINLKEIKRAKWALVCSEIFNRSATFGYCSRVEKINSGPENCFLKQFGYKKEEVEPFGHDRELKEILVWHTRTVQTRPVRGGTHGYLIEQ